MAEIRNILFDYGNVIMDIDIEGGFESIRELYPKEFTDLEWKGYFFDVALQHEKGDISSEEFINGVLEFAINSVETVDVVEA